MKRDKHKIVIIGAGPAGIACGVQLKRSGFHPVIIEKDRPGGLLHEASVVENYPGFPQGIKAIELIRRLGQHLEEYDIPVITEEVSEITYSERSFIVKTGRRSYTAEVLVIATGTSPTVPAIHLDDMKTSSRVLSGIRKIKEVSGMRISIIGAGDASFDYALSMAGKNSVSVFCRNNVIKALPLLKDRVEAHRHITFHGFHEISSIEWNAAAGCLKCRFNVEKSTREYPCDYLIFATGRKPSLGFMHPTLQAQVKTFEQRGLLYLVGDVRGGRHRQALIAAGEGISAAMNIADESNKQNPGT